MTKSGGESSEIAFEAALARYGLADPRPALRERLRALRESNATAFEEAKKHFEQMKSDAEPGEALEHWIAYGHFLGELTSPGKLYHIDEVGRAEPWSAPLHSGAMLVHLPEDSSAAALAVVLPSRMSGAQEATYSLLVARRLSL